MGGRISRPFPKCFPVRRALMNIASVQLPSPVSLSGVRFMVKEVPHGPLHAVRWAFVTAPHRSGVIPTTLSADTVGMGESAGWPHNGLDVSMIGPFGVKTLGEWQSLQRQMDTRYFPRSARD